MSHTLLLNADFSPIRVIPWNDAVCRVLDKKAYSVADYAGRVIHSAYCEYPMPAVLAQVRQSPSRNKIRFSRTNLLARDAYTCQYCGARPGTRPSDIEYLTLDHVVPRAQSVQGSVVLPWSGKRVSVTCWENVVAACLECNKNKADRTPAQAGMQLKTLPRKPSAWDAIFLSLRRTKIPDEWRAFLPEESAWRDYWDVELDPE